MSTVAAQSRMLPATSTLLQCITSLHLLVTLLEKYGWPEGEVESEAGHGSTFRANQMIRRQPCHLLGQSEN